MDTCKDWDWWRIGAGIGSGIGGLVLAMGCQGGLVALTFSDVRGPCLVTFGEGALEAVLRCFLAMAAVPGFSSAVCKSWWRAASRGWSVCSRSGWGRLGSGRGDHQNQSALRYHIRNRRFQNVHLADFDASVRD
eukprot:8347345-Pyramimonas_sp.AAC.1